MASKLIVPSKRFRNRVAARSYILGDGFPTGGGNFPPPPASMKSLVGDTGTKYSKFCWLFVPVRSQRNRHASRQAYAPEQFRTVLRGQRFTGTFFSITGLETNLGFAYSDHNHRVFRRRCLPGQQSEDQVCVKLHSQRQGNRDARENISCNLNARAFCRQIG